MDVGRVFSTSFAMLRQRFWSLVGMLGVFFVIQIVALFVLFLAIAGSAGLSAGITDPDALSSFSVGLIAIMVLVYGGYFLLFFVQEAALVTLASPLEEPAFGEALNRGFKSALPFLGIMVLLILAYVAVTLALFVVIGGASLAGDAAGGMVGGVLGLLFMPVLVYVGCRLSVLIPVVAVDQVFNPISAIRRSWSVTGGKVLAILLAFIGFFAISAVLIGVPALLMYFTLAPSELGTPNRVGLVIGLLVFFALFVVYTIFASAFSSALHATVTDGGAERLEEMFA